ncbi:MAG: D-hexose-6-phosphate mutarotase [Porticoccaceae bacterium]|jgi:D-hexose-6-phosphate mutarotase
MRHYRDRPFCKTKQALAPYFRAADELKTTIHGSLHRVILNVNIDKKLHNKKVTISDRIILFLFIFLFIFALSQ